MTHNIGILGCGDFLRWQAGSIRSASSIKVSALFDPDRSRAEHYAGELGGSVVESAEAIFNDPSIDIVLLYVPPWIRRGLFEQACAAGKHVLMTKPLASSAEDCAAMKTAAEAAGIRSAVIYGRSGNPWMAACRALLASGDKGRLALYRQDWLHAYPQWNNWATDPVKNGGPFMDAMIHNLNAANYLMGRPLTDACFFSDKLSHPDLTCADTESLVTHYEGGGMAHLFITWAADLAVHSTAGNDREHIDHFYLVTDQGWHLTQDKGGIRASRGGEVEIIATDGHASNYYQDFSEAVTSGGPIPPALATLDAAAADITLLREVEQEPGRTYRYEEVLA